MNYLAIHYVKIGKRMYTPGEVIDVGIPEGKVGRLLEKGAIREAGAPFYTPPVPVAPPEPPAQASAEGDVKAPGSDEDGDPETPALDDEQAEGEDGGEEVTGEAPEIDVMDGIVAEPKKPAKAAKATKPKTAGGRKKA